jgi:hypothetical protein
MQHHISPSPGTARCAVSGFMLGIFLGTFAARFCVAVFRYAAIVFERRFVSLCVESKTKHNLL